MFVFIPILFKFVEMVYDVQGNGEHDGAVVLR